MKASYDLMAGFNSGDFDAFQKIYNEYCTRLSFFARQYVRRKEDSEEIVSDIFIKLWQRHDRFATLQQIKAFLYIATRNACLNFVRLHPQNKQPVLIPDANSVSDIANTEAYYHEISTELIHLVASHLKTLSPKRRAIVEMIMFEGLSDEEVARRLNITTKTVRNQKNTAIRQLQASLGTNAPIVLSFIIAALQSGR